ncbi:hypothetical protein Tco_1480819, partial [Tanacetum coccineum]
MDVETAQTTITTKLHILKQGEYDIWRLRIKQYFQVQDYALWDVIKNRNSFKPVPQTTTNADGTSTTLIPGPITTKENVQVRAFFRQESKCPNFENGICESFNRAIVVQRSKPIITMLEDIRIYIMQRLVAMNKVARTWEHSITPSIRKRVEVLKEKQ